MKRHLEYCQWRSSCEEAVALSGKPDSVRLGGCGRCRVPEYGWITNDGRGLAIIGKGARGNSRASRTVKSSRFVAGGSVDRARPVLELVVRSEASSLWWNGCRSRVKVPGSGTFDRTLEVKTRLGHSMLGIGGRFRLRKGPCGLRHVPMSRMTLFVGPRLPPAGDTVRPPADLYRRARG